ncbi:MAG TPA: hypothetical protein VGB55_15840, partial [Tepidisphaeraceae bacterium]
MFGNMHDVGTPSLDYSSAPRSVKFGRFAVFTWLWAFGVSLGLVMFPSWAISPLGWLQALSLLAVLIFPGRVPIFAFFVLMSTLRGIEKMPLMANHIFFELLLSATMLVTLIVQMIRTRRWSVDGDEWLAGFAPSIRVQLAILYGFAVLHKLNIDYFTLSRSCGSRLLVMLTDTLYLPEPNDFFRWQSIVGTLVVELAIAGGLFFARTRKAALALGIGFHFFLGLLPHEGLPSFSAMLYAMYFLFFGDDMLPPVRTWLIERREQFAWAGRGASGRLSVIKLAAVVVAAGVLMLVAAGGLTMLAGTQVDHRPRIIAGIDFGKALVFLDRFALVAFAALAVPYIWMFCRALNVTGWRSATRLRGLLRGSRAAWVFVPI